MKRAYIGILVSAVALTVSAAFAADQSKDVRDLMTANQYRNAGLDKLTSDQMTALNADVTNISVMAAAHGPADLENILTADQFRSAGLDKLSPDQVASLNAWLTGYLRSQDQAASGSVAPAGTPAPAASAPAASTPAAFGAAMLKPTVDEPDNIHSSIQGKFTGWSGSTLFTLANGQVWQQSEPDDYSTVLMNPEVIIKKLNFGYLLTLPGHGQTVFVIRVK